MSGNPFEFVPQFPRDSLITENGGILTSPWRYLFMSLYIKLGSSVSVATAGYIQYVDGQAQIFPALPSGPQTIGQGGVPIATTAPKKGPQVQSLVDSPFGFQAPATGFMTIPGGKVEYSRDGALFYEVGLVGGQILILQGDMIRISWFNPAGPPAPVVWWEGGIGG